MPSPLPVLPASLVGSYAQPVWLIDRAELAGRIPPRVRAKELWRVDPEYLGQAHDDTTVVAIRAQERAGLTVATDCGMTYLPRAGVEGQMRAMAGAASILRAEL